MEAENVANQVQDETGSRIGLTRWDGFALIVPVIAIAPLLYVQSTLLWNRPHLQFFPISLLAYVYFLYSSHAAMDQPSRIRSQFALLIACIGYLACIAAALVYSPWIAHLALVVVLLGWSIGRFAGESITRLMALTLLLLIILPLPFNTDARLIQDLQNYSARACGYLLDAFAIPHYPQGNVLVVRSKRLFVEEACSGVGSLYTLAAVGILISLSNRLSMLRSALLLLSVPIWATLGNLIRLSAIALSLEWFQVDLSSDLPHSILGLIVFLIAGIGLWSTYSFLEFLLSPIPKLTEERGKVTRSVIRMYNGLVDYPQLASSAPSAKAVSTDRAENGRLSPLWFVASAVLLAAGSIPAYIAWKSPRGASIQFSEELAKEFPSQYDLPETIGAAKMVEYHTERRSHMSTFGEFSNVWQYRAANHEFLISLDFPFRGWHGLWSCYHNTGWVIDDIQVFDSLPSSPQEESKNAWPFVQVLLHDELNTKAYLWFALFDELGKPFAAQDDQLGSALQTRMEWTLPQMLERASGQILEPVTYQVQLFSKSGQELDEASLDYLRSTFLELRNVVLEKSKPTLDRIQQQ